MKLTVWSGETEGVVIMLNKKMQKLMAAFVLVGFMGSTSLPIIAEASSYHSEHAQEQRIQHQREEQRIQHQREEQRIQRQQEKQRIQHHREEQRRQRQREDQRRNHHNNDNESHSDTGNLVTGLLIGGVIGSIIGNN